MNLIAKSPFFDGIDQVDHPSYNVKLPIFYYDASSMTMIFTASTKEVRKRLPSKDMHPLEIVPGRCLVAFSAFEYKATDIGPYNEFGIAALISYRKRAIPGLSLMASMLANRFTTHVLHLPVTSERARNGAEMAGYTKFIADIRFARNAKVTVCTVAEKGETILEMTGPRVRTSNGPRSKFVLVSVKNGIPLTANMYINPKAFKQVIGGGGSTVKLGERHPIAKDLKGLKLSKAPHVYQFMPSFEAILFGGKNLIDD